MKKALLYLYMIFLIVIILDGVIFASLSTIYLGFFSYEVAFLDIPLIVWGIVNTIIFIVLFALPIWFLNFLNKIFFDLTENNIYHYNDLKRDLKNHFFLNNQN